MSRMFFMAWLGSVAGVVCVQGASSTDWPRWRGPTMDSIGVTRGALLPWPEAGPPVLWRASVGTGFSSLAVSGGRAFTLGNRNGYDTVYCLDAATGAILWTNSYACDLSPNLYQGGPSATPAVDGSLAYTLSKFGHLFCLRVADGSIAWQTNLITGLGLVKPEWGFAGSPVIEGDMLLLNAGGYGLALDKLTGAVRWLANTARAGYSTVVPFDLNGTRAGVFMSYTSVVCVALSDGRLLWKKFWRSGADVNIPDPTVSGDRLFLTGYIKTGRLVRPEDGQDISGSIDLKTHMSPGVVLSNHLYAFHGDAELPCLLKCLDLQTGAIRWSTNLGVFNLSAGALIAADNKLIVLTGDGELILAEANPASWRQISRTRVYTSRTWTLPALAGDRLYLRDATGEVLSIALSIASPPQLTIQVRPGAVELTWPANAAGFALESTSALGIGQWTAVDATPVADGDRLRVAVVLGAPSAFFRLGRP